MDIHELVVDRLYTPALNLWQSLFSNLEQQIHRTGRTVLFFAALLLTGTPHHAATQDHSLLDQLAALENGHLALCPSTAFEADFPTSFDLLIKDFARESSLIEGDPTEVLTLNRMIFDRLGIKGSRDLKDACNLLPSRVLKRKQGYCVGIAALYLVLAEQLNLPIHAVATPSHVFLRYDDGSSRINVETLQEGANIPDEQYIREQRIPEESIRRGIFMRNLTTEEFLAQVHNNLGVIYSERKEYEKAAVEYERALDLDPHLPAAFYNYGSDLLRTRTYRRAARLFSKSLRLYPTDVWALNNRGLAYLKMGKTPKARRDFEEAVKIDPTFEQGRRNLQGIR